MFETSGPLRRTENLLEEILREVKSLREDIKNLEDRLQPGKSRISDPPEKEKIEDPLEKTSIAGDLDRFIAENLDLKK